MKLVTRVAVFASAMLVVVMVILGFVAYSETQAAGPLLQTKLVNVARGDTVSAIAARLEAQSIVSDARLFKIYVRAKGLTVRAGEFEIPARASMIDVADILDHGRSFSRTITFPEGLSSAQIVAQINAADFMNGKIETVPAEGTLHPNTYGYARGDDRAALIKRMTRSQQLLLDMLWQQSEGTRPNEITSKAVLLKLASLVEKESSQIVEDQRKVAAVFVNRLKRGMKMQSDPTVIYGIEKDSGKPMGRALWRKDLTHPSAYNTYVHEGLPPTPICNPGEGAMRAVLDPAPITDLYFVADGTGGHAFAKTLAQHNRNVAKWRKIQKQR